MDNIVGANSVINSNAFYQDHYDTMQDSIDAGLLDNVDKEYILDVSYAPYNVDPRCTSRAYSTMMLKKCNILGWDDIIEPDECDEDTLAYIHTKQDSINNSKIKVLSHSSKQYALLADCDTYDVRKCAYGYDYNVYTSDIDMFVYGNVSNNIECRDVDGQIVEVDLNKEECIKRSKKGNIYHIEFNKDIDISTIGIRE